MLVCGKHFQSPTPRDPTPEDDSKDATFADDAFLGAPPQDRVASVPAATPSDNPETTENEADPDEPIDAVFTDVKITERDLKAIQHNKDPKKMTARWFKIVSGTPLDDDDARHAFIAERIEGVSSLAEAVDILPADKFDKIISDAEAFVKDWRAETARQAQLETPKGWHPSMSGHLAKTFVSMIQATGLKCEEIYPFVSMIIGRHVFDRAQIESFDVIRVLKETGSLDDEGNWTFDEKRANVQLFLFDGWLINEGAAGVLD